MRQVISQESASDAKVCVTSSERLSAAPDGVKLDHDSCIAAVAHGHLAASADGRFAAQVVRAEGGGYVIRHSHVEFPQIPFKPEQGKRPPRILRVTENGVLAWASRLKQTGLFEIDDDGIHFRVEMQQCDGCVPGAYMVFGIHEEDGIPRRRFVRTASWSILDEPLWHDIVTNAWKTVEQQPIALPDGRYVSVRRTRKGWERLLIGDGPDTERAALTHAASVRSHLLSSGFVDILNDGSTYRMLFRGRCTVHGGSVERSWQSPDGKRLLFVEVLSDQNDPQARELGPQRRLVQLDINGERKNVAVGRICLEPDAVIWTPDGQGYAAFVRQLQSMKDGFALYQDVVHVSAEAKLRTIPAKLPMGSRARQALVTKGGTVAALLVDDGANTKLQVRGPSFGPYTFAWNLAYEDESGGVSFNAVIGNDIHRIVVS